MNAIEANVLLTKLSVLETRLRRQNDDDRLALAEMWAELLPDVSLAEALAAGMSLLGRARGGDPAIMPADVRDEAGAAREVSPWPDLNDEITERMMRKDLAALGTTPELYRSDPAVRAQVDAAMDARAIEEAQ